MADSLKPIELSVARFYPGRTASVLLAPQNFAQKPEFTFNMEQVLVGSWDKYTGPYCSASSIDVKGRDSGLTAVLRGDLDLGALEPGRQIPYALRLAFDAEPFRVRIRGEMLDLDASLLGFTPCLYSLAFSRENHPPFEMARKSFMYFRDKGFTWLSDAERTRSEWHRDPPVDDGGPWIQLFVTEAFANVPAIRDRMTLKETAVAPVAGWVANDDAYLVAIASKNAFQAGIRWGPCLHSDIACVESDQDRIFETIVYILPVDLAMLHEMLKADWSLPPDALQVSEKAMWPRTIGRLLNGFEGDDIEAWSVSGGTLVPYKSERLWINGNLERVTYAEGYTEGKGAALWQIPPGGEETVLKGPLDASSDRDTSITHVAVDVMNRSMHDVQLSFIADLEAQRTSAQELYRLHPWANRRLLLPLPDGVMDLSGTVMVTVAASDQETRLVLDNLRFFQR
jgi:hypothetical protein